MRADDRNEVAHQAARVGRQRVSGDRDLLGHRARGDPPQPGRARGADRPGRSPGGRAGGRHAGPRAASGCWPPSGWPRPARSAAGSRSASPRRRPPAREWEVRTAGLVERRRVLAERLAEVERRLTGHAEERQQAAERRTRLESDATAVERLLGVVAEAQSGLDALLSVAPRPSPPPARGGPGRWGPPGGAASPALGQRARAGRHPQPAAEGRARPGRGHHPP